MLDFSAEAVALESLSPDRWYDGGASNWSGGLDDDDDDDDGYEEYGDGGWCEICGGYDCVRDRDDDD